MQNYTMKVSKKEEGEYKEVGQVAVYYPLLNELGLSVEASGKDEEGFPTYADEKVQYVFDAVLAAVKATARNRLVSGTATLKDGNKIAETIEELLATGERSGEALKIRREYFASFKAWLPTLGKSAAWVQGIYDIVSNSKNLPYQSQARKDAIVGYLAAHADTLSAEDVSRFERVLLSLNELAQTADPLA